MKKDALWRQGLLPTMIPANENSMNWLAVVENEDLDE
jgi:hypothetical protein